MADPTTGSALLLPARQYAQIARMWVRAALAYPASFAMFAVGSFLGTGLDFVGIWVMFTRIDSLGGFTLHEIGEVGSDIRFIAVWRLRQS